MILLISMRSDLAKQYETVIVAHEKKYSPPHRKYLTAAADQKWLDLNLLSFEVVTI